MKTAKYEPDKEAFAKLLDIFAGKEAEDGFIESMAKNASEKLGSEVTTDDIKDAISEVKKIADENHVSVEELFKASIQSLNM